MKASPRNLIQASKEDKVSWNRLWSLSVNFVMGKQNLIFSSKDRKFVVPENREIVFNLLLNLYRNVISRLAAAYPGVSVIPASPSQEDLAKAKSSEQALRYFWTSEDLKKKFQTISEWLVSCGSCATHTFYDPDKKDVCIRVIAPYDVFFEKYARSEEESSFVAVRSYVNRDNLKKIYPDKAEQIEKAPSANRDNDQEPLPEGTVEVFDIYFKDGTYKICVDDEILFEGELPEGCSPVVFIRYTNIPGQLWGMSMIAPLIDIQTQYNRSRNQLIINSELMTNPKWLIPKTSGVSANALTDRPGEKVVYNPGGGAPTPVGMPPVPSYVIDSLNQLHNELLDVAGVHSVSLGKRVIGLTSGKAIESTFALDASQLQVTQNNIEEGFKLVAKTVLILMKAFYDEPKMMRMLDGTGSVVFKELQSTDIVDDPEIFIETGTMFQDEAQNREAKIMQAFQVGLLSKSEAKDQLNLKSYQSDVLEKMASISHAQNILAAILKGAKVEIYADDDLSTFQKVFKEFINGRDYNLQSIETQEYLSDLYKAIIVALRGQLPEEDKASIFDRARVWPPSSEDSKDLAIQTVAQRSGAGQEQVLERGFEKAQKEIELRAALEQGEGQ